MGEEYRSLSSALCSCLHSPVTLSLLGTNIFLSTLFSNNLSLCSFLNVGDQVPHPYKTTGKIIVPNILIPVWSYWSPIGCLPGWRIGERSPDMEGTGEIKYPGHTKTSTTALQLTEGSVKARGRRPRKQITWS